MVLSTGIRRLKTLHRLGFANSVRIIKQRHKSYTFNRTWRTKKAHTWGDIAQQQGCTPNFEQFFNQQRARSLPVLEPLLRTIADAEYVRMADAYVRNEFAVLGSAPRIFADGLPWHEDIRLSGQDSAAEAQFDATSWYTDIAITTSWQQQCAQDIKVPWELSRLQHLVVLGRAYAATYDERYAATFVEHMRSWWASNPFLHGINWVCPMEVGLRAISMVVAFTSFSRSSAVDDQFWLTYVTSLYDHMIYLEHNWELYDLRTSNHYIADLVGYLYLCWFFSDCPGMASRTRWCHQELLAELNKQINADGSSYEQATAYHRLVAELFYHHKLIAQQLRLPMPATAEGTFGAICTYLRWCTPEGGALVTIGDNDSGVVTVAGLPDALIASQSRSADKCPTAVRHFEYAGLSIIKTDTWHVTLRHSVYNDQAPTSHLHNDGTSITLAYKGVSFIVDPGSYVYTPSAVWRNRFRSVSAHSGMYLTSTQPLTDDGAMSSRSSRVILVKTVCPAKLAEPDGPDKRSRGIQASCFLQPVEPIPLDNNIFLLRRTPATMPQQSTTPALSARTTHDEYLRYGWRPERCVTLNEQASVVTINDQWLMSGATSAEVSLQGCIQFLLHPAVRVSKQTEAVWRLEAAGITLELANPALSFELVPAWYSPSYGVKLATQMLISTCELGTMSVNTTIRVVG